MIEVEHLTKRYGTVTAVDDVTFRVNKGEILGFLGPNGAGKTTTMLKRIAGILGWVGTAAVAVAVYIRMFKSDWAQYGVYAAWVGLVLVLLYLLSQWKETAASMGPRSPWRRPFRTRRPTLPRHCVPR